MVAFAMISMICLRLWQWSQDPALGINDTPPWLLITLPATTFLGGCVGWFIPVEDETSGAFLPFVCSLAGTFVGIGLGLVAHFRQRK